MITRIELDGFKTFQNFAVDLGPFQVIVGANGVGKSNLFDAFRLIANLARADTAPRHYSFGLRLGGARGDTEQLFTLTKGNQVVDRMRLAIEMLVSPQVTDLRGETAQLTHTRLRYELEIQRVPGPKQFILEEKRVVRESLFSLDPKNDRWLKKHGVSTTNGWLPPGFDGQSTSKEFISTQNKTESLITLHQDGKGNESSHPTAKLNNTVLASVNSIEFPHVLAAQRELADAYFLHLNPDMLRFSPVETEWAFYPSGSDQLDLAAMLEQAKWHDEYLLNDISRDFAELVPGMVKVDFIREELTRTPVIWITSQDGRAFSWQSLSDGSLRMLALAVLANDPNFSGLFCMEEPENGVHPLRLSNIARLLKGMATDFSLPRQADEPLRQVLVSTHSPVLVSQPEVVDSLLFAYMVTSVQPGQEPRRITQISPVTTRSHLENQDENEAKIGSYTLAQVEKYLSTTEFEAALQTLEVGHAQ
jgi:predicted ATPase